MKVLKKYNSVFIKVIYFAFVIFVIVCYFDRFYIFYLKTQTHSGQMVVSTGQKLLKVLIDLKSNTR